MNNETNVLNAEWTVHFDNSMILFWQNAFSHIPSNLLYVYLSAEISFRIIKHN